MSSTISKRSFLKFSVLTILLLCVMLLVQQPVQAAPPNFQAPVQVATGLTTPTQMQFAPDGRLFVAEQNGGLRVIDTSGTLLPTPFTTVTTTTVGERGLLGIAFDPNFLTNGYVYVLYTVTTPTIHNRISRFTADPLNPNQAQAASEQIIFEMDTVDGTNHNGGAMHFGSDGNLYVATGDSQGGATGLNAQMLTNTHGKILRINPDGTIPTDNPFYASTTGIHRAIWALGLRNPFTFAFQPGTNRMFINDVGEGNWEEINEGVAGANFGWPYFEADDPGLVAPVPGGFTYNSPMHTYATGVGGTCAITGGTFYNDTVFQYPTSYLGDYFFGDFCAGTVTEYDTASNTPIAFYDSLGFGVVDIKTSPAGEIYYLTRGSGGAVYRLPYNGAPQIVQNPQSIAVDSGTPATFTCLGTGGANLQYQWQVGGVNIPGATSASYTTPTTANADDGNQYACVVTNAGFGSVTSTPATLTVNPQAVPVAQANIGVFDPAISKIGFLVPGQVGVTGEQLEWVITVSNTGNATGNNIVVTDTLRDELQIDSVQLPVGTSSINGQTVTVNIPTIAPGQAIQFSIFTTVLVGAQVDNTACLTADNFDGEECVSARAIRSLPATGETPWWRMWVLMGALASVLLAIGGLAMLFVMDMALTDPVDATMHDIDLYL